ncbi:hypothetical protein [Sulfurimonas sp. HSL-1716]|uniref:hypothetical protein n=1 Tax=Hydrocurvibacter sulfurireducens TaxID=3131937 RepID=UPI0031F8C9E5
MSFANSMELLAFHKVAYTAYSLLIISVIAWFGYNLTRKHKANSLIRVSFYTYIAFLVAAGVGHHIFTYNVVPWVSEDITRNETVPDKSYHITVKDHHFILPKEKMVVNCGEKVLFDVKSKDLVYGFGLFRKDHSMVTQMQVNPGTKNDILWTFNESGVFDLMSTEYSGPKGNGMFVPDVLKVQCTQKIAMVDGGKV